MGVGGKLGKKGEEFKNIRGSAKKYDSYKKKVCNCEKSGNIEKIQESLPEMRKSLLKKVSFGKIDRNRKNLETSEKFGKVNNRQHFQKKGKLRK